jgi:hypothetical protein
MSHADGLQVREPAALCLGCAERPGAGVAVANILSKLRALSADIACI